MDSDGVAGGGASEVSVVTTPYSKTHQPLTRRAREQDKKSCLCGWVGRGRERGREREREREREKREPYVSRVKLISKSNPPPPGRHERPSQ